MANVIDYKDGADVVLFYPKTGMDLGATVAPPHALLTVAAPLLKNGFRVLLIDQRVDPAWEEHLRQALVKKPICVGLSTMTGTQIFFALNAAKIIREVTNGQVPLIWGGAHPTSLPEQTAQNEYVDIVCVGEGDIAFLEIVQALANHQPLSGVAGIVFKENGQIGRTPARPLLDVETLLPVPWEILDVEKYIHRDFYLKGTNRSMDIGQTSRGCPYNCGFCSSATLRQRKWRAMSVEKSLDRILSPIKRFNLDSIWIRDDEFYIDRRRVEGICQGMIASGQKIKWYTSGTRVDVFNRSTDADLALIKKSGAGTLKFGAESGSNRILDLMQKGIHWEDTVKANLRAKRAGITPAFALMIGFPTETFDDINQTIDLFVRLKKDNPQAEFEVIGTYTALPETPLYKLALAHGLRPPTTLAGWIDWLSDEYDIEGRKIPWFNYQQRRSIGNITYMSILANTAPNAINGISNGFWRNFLKACFFSISRVERFKLAHKMYSFAPELDLARFLRRRLFYGSPRTS